MSLDIEIKDKNEIKIGLSGQNFDDILYCTGHTSVGLNSYSFDIEDYYLYSDTFDYNTGIDLSKCLNDEIITITVYKNDL